MISTDIANTVVPVSGEIKFSHLRKSFLKMRIRENFSDTDTFDAETGSVSASQLLRDTTSNPNPIVPDCTENSQVAESENLKVSQFRNTVKYYYMRHTGTTSTFTDFGDGTESNWNGNPEWDGNLFKTIQKKLFVEGELQSGLYVSGISIKNLDVEIRGNVYGYRGTGGLTSGSNGSAGGPAVYIRDGGTNVTVTVKNTAKLYGGGGGGGAGASGGRGGKGGLGYYSIYTGTVCIPTGGSCSGCSPSVYCGGFCTNWHRKNGQVFCLCCQNHAQYNQGYVSGGTGGTAISGGAGGSGRGASDSPEGGTLAAVPPGIGETDGTNVGPSAGGSYAGDGGLAGTAGRGGDGGDWGKPGEDGATAFNGEIGKNGNAGLAPAGLEQVLPFDRSAIVQYNTGSVGAFFAVFDPSGIEANQTVTISSGSVTLPANTKVLQINQIGFNLWQVEVDKPFGGSGDPNFNVNFGYPEGSTVAGNKGLGGAAGQSLRGKNFNYRGVINTISSPVTIAGPIEITNGGKID